MIELQRTAEWHQARLGKLTASRIADATARTKTGYGASRANYMSELLIERLTGQPAPHYQNGAMQWGTENEPSAIAAYEFSRNIDVAPVGFIDHPKLPMAGASPDGFIGDDGLIEVKCPNSATHIATLLGEPIDGAYIKQMQWQMACTGRKWCEWVSFDPRVPVAMQLFIKQIARDDKMIADLEKEAVDFLRELDSKLTVLRAKYIEKAAA